MHSCLNLACSSSMMADYIQIDLALVQRPQPERETFLRLDFYNDISSSTIAT